MTIGKIVKYIFIWQVWIILITSLSGLFLPLRPMFLGGRDLANPVNPNPYKSNPFLFSRANFDGIHYIEMARRGYDNLQQAFFPFYSNLIRLLTPYFANSTLAAVTISTLSFSVGLILLYQLIKLDYSTEIASLVVILLLVFPTSFFFSSVYTEGLFFMLTVGSFLAARKHNWLLAGVLGGLASYTRFVGILLLPALLIEWWTSKSKLKNLLPILLIPLGLLIYMQFLSKTTGDPLAFIHVQKSFNQGRSDKIVLIYQVFWRYFKMVTTVNRSDPLYITILVELASGLIFTFLSIYSFFKVRLSYAFYGLMSFIIPTLTGSFTSLPRYVLVSFPAFIASAVIITSWSSPLRKTVFLICILFQGVLLAMFVRGYWVS